MTRSAPRVRGCIVFLLIGAACGGQESSQPALQSVATTAQEESLSREAALSEEDEVYDPDAVTSRTLEVAGTSTRFLETGPRSGLDVLLLQTAESYEKETAAALGRVMTIVPAVFIVCLALLVGFILAAVLLPIMTMDITSTGF